MCRGGFGEAWIVEVVTLVIRMVAVEVLVRIRVWIVLHIVVVEVRRGFGEIFRFSVCCCSCCLGRCRAAVVCRLEGCALRLREYNVSVECALHLGVGQTIISQFDKSDQNLKVGFGRRGSADLHLVQ